MGDVKVAVYAIRNAESWKIRISLDLRVDLKWWGRVVEDTSYKMVFIADEIPLGWAMKLAQMELRDKGIDGWHTAQWKKAISAILEEELQEAGKYQSAKPYLHVNSMWMYEVRNEQQKGMIKVQEFWESRSMEAGRGRKSGDLQHHGVMKEVLQEAEVLAESLQGRSLLMAEVDALLEEAAPAMVGAWLTAAQLAYLQGKLVIGTGVAPVASSRPSLPGRKRALNILRCRRCGSVALGRTACASCGSAACTYCEACLAMGRSRSCTLLLRGATHPAVRGMVGGSPTEPMSRWGLSAAQSAAAEAALRFLTKPPIGDVVKGTLVPSSNSNLTVQPDRFLLWAVTGAGKTEMIFPLLDSVLQASGLVLVATPRRDVVLELAPRLAKAFPDEEVFTLYGGSQERWRPGNLTLATTHQLMRFYQAFDLVIIDEIDAFPFHNDPMLAYSAHHACKPEGKFVYLSATPPRELQREAASGKLAHAKVPVRFHGHPLPVPNRLDMKSVAQCLGQQRIPDKLLRNLRQSIQRGAQCFIFVSRIHHIEPLVMLLRIHLPTIRIEGTSSVDPQRAEKVLAFRDTHIRLLITTTILERGVTVPKSDVYILDADSGLFDEASLIQMAGRAGRSKDDPKGKVFLASTEWTRSQKRAVSQIKGMNRIAHKEGYLGNGHKDKQRGNI